MTFEPKAQVLPAAQRALWAELREIPAPFVLYGGTALALRLGHRGSVDFDFFSPDPLDFRSLNRRIGFLSGAAVLQEEPDVLTVSVDRGGPVKVSLFGSISAPRKCRWCCSGSPPENYLDIVRPAARGRG